MTNRVRVYQNVSRLGRHVNHDPESKRFAFKAEAVQLVNKRHNRYIPVLDQGNLGSCTGNAGTGALGTGDFFATLPAKSTLDEKFAVQLYSDATQIDDYTAGNYPPTDTGSDGLSIAKVLQRRGLISGYQHTFTLNDALAALVSQPVIIGVNWYSSMYDPDSNGLVTISPKATIEGGHEVVLDEINVDKQLVTATNSWGTGWGVKGRFSMSFDTFGRLLKEQGDCTVFVPLTKPAPIPTPPAPVVNAFPWSDVDPWLSYPHVYSRATKAAAALKKWKATQA